MKGFISVHSFSGFPLKACGNDEWGIEPKMKVFIIKRYKRNSAPHAAIGLMLIWENGLNGTDSRLCTDYVFVI